MGVKIDSRKVRAGEKWIFRKITNMTAGARPLRWVGSYTPPPHTFWPRNLIFGLNDPWDMRKKRIFLFFEIFIFTLFIGIFRFFPYITLVNFWFQATGHRFSPRNLIFGLREPCPIEK